MADLVGDSASMMGSFDPSAFTGELTGSERLYSSRGYLFF